MRRLSFRVEAGDAEIARAFLAEISPQGWEEREVGGAVELAAFSESLETESTLRRRFGPVEIDEVPAGWATRWRAFHRPVTVGPLWIGPPWEAQPKSGPSVVIDPGLGFGTGAHPTTQLCLELLLGERRTDVLDIGCGSGVLAIAAARLGFGPVRAVDHDAAAVTETRTNAAANGVAVEVTGGDALADPLPRATLALANLERASIGPLAERLRSDRLIASGYLAGESVALDDWMLIERRTLQGWAAELFARRPSAGSG